MRSLNILPGGAPCRVLCIGAHSDDIEIGAGGTLLSWIAGGAELDIRWCVASATGDREREARASAGEFICGAARVEVNFAGLQDAHFPSEYSRGKQWMAELARGPCPDIILTHRRADAHQDHRVISELTWSTFRNHLILEYEIPKWDGDSGQPNIYSPLVDEILERKISLLERNFASQHGKDWYGAETFRGLARMRGMECREHYAEAFWAHKIVLSADVEASRAEAPTLIKPSAAPSDLGVSVAHATGAK